MGACSSSSADPELAAQERRNREIEKQNMRDKRKDGEMVKLLLLGAGESGKSTIFKQMKLLYGHGYSKEELLHMRPVIFRNIHENLSAVLQASKQLRVKIKRSELAKEYRGIIDAAPDVPVSGQVAEIMRRLWGDSGVRRLWAKRSEYQVLDGLAHYMASLERIGDSKYLPSPADVLHARVRTTGIVEDRYVIDGTPFLIVDVGGQRNERKKWIHCFDNVTAMIFVAAISEYDQVLFEDSKTNRIDEAVKLFGDVCNNGVFRTTSIILFLNKRDIFEEKLFVKPLRIKGVRNDKFQGPYAEDPKVPRKAAILAAQEYMKNLFLSVARLDKRQVFVHVTCATDTNNFNKVIDAVRATILRENLSTFGLNLE